jgi:hypothetical protein
MNYLIIGIMCLIMTCATEKSAIPSSVSAEAKDYIDFDDYKIKANEAWEYCSSKGLNTDFFFLVDMGMHSGLKRFHVWDFQKQTIVDSYMVSHGCADRAWSTDNTKLSPIFSNEEGSHATSLGKYIIGERGYSNWGINVKYLLHGMDKTNNNALKRTVVLHSWEKVTDNEIFPDGTAEGWGCPAVSNNSMVKIDSLLRYNKKKTLLWVVN